ncbi:hypothetical protein WA026_007962 [Henosepilachna vigintioctopunctata]|uniref:Uncharacterized protein n=1 Tax=Henosepilachna vigintioctopunctata TaxID=420089 RepID=A0AAW1TPQ6_9CUCU
MHRYTTPQMFPPISSLSPQEAQIVSVHNRKMLQRNTPQTSTASFASIAKKRKPQPSPTGYDKIAHNNALIPSTSHFNPASILMNNKKSENHFNQTSSVSPSLSKDLLKFIANQFTANNTEFVQSLLEFISYQLTSKSSYNPHRL